MEREKHDLSDSRADREMPGAISPRESLAVLTALTNVGDVA